MTTTNTTARQNCNDLADAFEADGWQIGKPAHVSPECIALDKETAAEAVCDHCGHLGLEFLPYRLVNRRQRGYRVLAWCAACDAAIEL